MLTVVIEAVEEADTVGGEEVTITGVVTTEVAIEGEDGVRAMVLNRLRTRAFLRLKERHTAAYNALRVTVPPKHVSSRRSPRTRPNLFFRCLLNAANYVFERLFKMSRRACLAAEMLYLLYLDAHPA